MNLKQLSKQEQQKLALVVVGIVAVLLGLYYGAGFASRHIAERKLALEALQNDFEAARANVDRRDAIARNLSLVDERLNRAITVQMPPSETALKWASQVLNTHARKTGIAIGDLEEATSGETVFTAKDCAKRSLLTYGVRVKLQASYAETVRLIQSLEEENPYLAVLGMDIKADEKSPERHAVEITLQWPRWKDPAKIAPYVKDRAR